jgi:hypothetical protein
LPQSAEDIYAYSDPMDVTCYPNVFRMAEGRIIAIFLRAKITANGNFAGDEICFTNLTDAQHPRGTTMELAQNGKRPVLDDQGQGCVTDNHVYLSVGDTIAVVAIDALYRWRVQRATTLQKLGDKEYRTLGQGGPKGAIAFFSAASKIAALDPEATRAQLSPSFVVAVQDSNGSLVGPHPIGSSGYVMRVQANGDRSVELAK